MLSLYKYLEYAPVFRKSNILVQISKIYFLDPSRINHSYYLFPLFSHTILIKLSISWRSCERAQKMNDGIEYATIKTIEKARFDV